MLDADSVLNPADMDTEGGQGLGPDYGKIRGWRRKTRLSDERDDRIGNRTGFEVIHAVDGQGVCMEEKDRQSLVDARLASEEEIGFQRLWWRVRRAHRRRLP